MNENIIIIGEQKAKAVYDIKADSIMLPISGTHLERARTMHLPLFNVEDEGYFMRPADWKKLLPDSAQTITMIEQGLLRIGREARKEP